jgi:hypothetical protein
MKRLVAISAVLALALALPAAAQKAPPMVSIGESRGAAAAASTSALLPKIFAGWEMTGAAEISKDAATADPTNAAVLKEYGLTDYAAATYTRPGRKMTVKAIRFKDASGAYGAYTFYKLPEMLNEKFGDQGSSLNERVLFYRGNILVEAHLDKVTVMSAAELRELAGDLPLATGQALGLPTLPTYLPRQSYVTNSAKYVLGPAGLAAVQAPLGADLVDFSKDAEVVLGKYNTSAGAATLMVLSYPTPQIAAERLRAIESSHPTAAEGGDQFLTKRTGPMLVLLTGKISVSEGKSLLASVNYDPQVTWNQRTGLNPKDNIGNLIINNFLLIGVLFLFAIVLGVAFGAFRLLIKRLFPDRVFDRDIEIIRLNLR